MRCCCTDLLMSLSVDTNGEVISPNTPTHHHPNEAKIQRLLERIVSASLRCARKGVGTKSKHGMANETVCLTTDRPLITYAFSWNDR